MNIENSNGFTTNLTEQFEASARPTLTVDLEKYQNYLDDSDMSPSQKQAYLEAIWVVIVSFVEFGFGVHPAQEVCGKGDESVDLQVNQAFNGTRSNSEHIVEAGKPTAPEGG